MFLKCATNTPHITLIEHLKDTYDALPKTNMAPEKCWLQFSWANRPHKPSHLPGCTLAIPCHTVMDLAPSPGTPEIFNKKTWANKGSKTIFAGQFMS